MVKLLGFVLLLSVSATAQAPLLRVAAKDGQTYKLLLERRSVLMREWQQLDQTEMIIKLRACLDNKLDSTKCDTMQIVPDGEGFVLREIPKVEEKKP